MKATRRNFLKTTAIGAAGGALALSSCKNTPSQHTDYTAQDNILQQPVLKRELFTSPVIIDKLQLLHYKGNFFCTVTSKDGAEGICSSNNMQMEALYPIFTHRLQPFFIGKDARDLDQLIDEVYVYKSNYKLQSLALWVPLATIEFAILDMLGKIAGKSMGELIGTVHHKEIAVYQATNTRGVPAEKSIEEIAGSIDDSQARAVKIKIGGRMSNNQDDPPGRSEKLIPLVRKTFGDDMVCYADSNGSYTPDVAIKFGKMLEEYNYAFYEEPVPFDWYEETREVADALTIPIAGGEQEASMHAFRWLIKNKALQIVQPDIFYFGGMIRSMRVARMAQAEGLECTPHISGSGLGYVYMMHFVSVLPNAGPYHEFKGLNKEIPMHCPTSSLTSKNGVVKVPTGPGLGVEIDTDYIKKHSVIS